MRARGPHVGDWVLRFNMRHITVYSVRLLACFIYRGPSIGSTMTIHTNLNCEQGSVFWNYPQGNLRVVFERESVSAMFEVCLTKDGGSYNLNRIIDVGSGTIIPKPIGRCTPDVCIPIAVDKCTPFMRVY